MLIAEKMDFLKPFIQLKNSCLQMRVLHTMSFLIERMGPHIKTSSQIASLTKYLPILWITEHNMLKAAVVSTCIQLVHVNIK